MHLFEFMDQDWLPGSLRATMRDILECGNSWPFRSYYDWVVHEIIRVCKRSGASTVVELGAGTAPLTRRLVRNPDAENLNLIVCDANPDAEAYRELEVASSGRIVPHYSPVDFSKSGSWPRNSLLVLSATLHHVPHASRMAVLNALGSNGNQILVFEPLRHNIRSVLFVGLSLIPAVLTPLRYIGREGRLRRIIWCWLIPIAPLMFIWDGIVSCIRQWTSKDWDQQLNCDVSRLRQWRVQSRFFSQFVEITPVSSAHLPAAAG